LGLGVLVLENVCAVLYFLLERRCAEHFDKLSVTFVEVRGREV
jgi:hypothetical protein